MQTEIVLMWVAVTAYAVAAVLFTFGFVFRRDVMAKLGLRVALAGLVPHGAAIVMRWIEVGHGPYLGFYEVVSSYAFVSVLVLGVLAWRAPTLRILGVAIMPVAFLMLGGAMLSPKAPLEVSGKLASWWLNIHVAFAKLSYASFAGAFALAVVYLIREARAERGGVPEDGVLSRLPAQQTLDDWCYRLVGVGFIFLSIMIVSGAIWANEAWGRYWAWDPIETWSLVSWLIYAGYLHTRLTLRWAGRRSAWYAVVSLPVLVFTLIGVPLAYQSIHGAYLKGY